MSIPPLHMHVYSTPHHAHNNNYKQTKNINYRVLSSKISCVLFGHLLRHPSVHPKAYDDSSPQKLLKTIRVELIDIRFQAAVTILGSTLRPSGGLCRNTDPSVP